MSKSLYLVVKVSKRAKQMPKKATNWTYNLFSKNRMKKNFGKSVISPICGFFRHFLALFDTFTSRYNDFDIKFKFAGYFYPYKHFILKSVLKMNQKCPSDLCALGTRTGY